MATSEVGQNNQEYTTAYERLQESDKERVKELEQKKADFNVMERYWREQEKLIREEFNSFKSKQGIKHIWQAAGENLVKWKDFVTNIYKARRNIISYSNRIYSLSMEIFSLVLNIGKMDNCINLTKHIASS